MTVDRDRVPVFGRLPKGNYPFLGERKELQEMIDGLIAAEREPTEPKRKLTRFAKG